MDTSNNINGLSKSLTKPAIALVLALSLTISGCSGGDEGGSGNSGGSGNGPQTSQAAGQTSAAPEETTAAASEAASTVSTEETMAQGDSAEPEAQGPSTALSGGLEEARERAESWNEDAELYGIASLRSTVNAEGENSGWLYSFVSESTGSVISVPYVDGQLRTAQGQELPEGQIRRIADDTISTSELVDSPEAIRRSDDVQSYLQENPQAGASAGLDSGSGDEAEWILSIPSEALQDRVPAAK